MKKNRFLTFAVFAITTILSFLISCATLDIEEDDIGLKGQSYRNPNVIVINAKSETQTPIYAGEFYKFDFKGFKEEGRFAIVEVTTKSDEKISFYSIGYSKKQFNDVFFISPHAGKVKIAISDSEYSYKKLKETILVESSENPVNIGPDQIVAGEFNSFDFYNFKDYCKIKNRQLAENSKNSEIPLLDDTTYGIIECYDNYGQLINKITSPALSIVKDKKLLIPAKTNLVKFAISGSHESYYTPIDFVSVRNSYDPITIKSFIASSFRTLDLNTYQKDIKQEYGIIEYLDKDYKSIYRDSIKNDGNGILKGKVYIPKEAAWANLAYSNSEFNYNQTFDYIDILSSTNDSTLKSPSSYYQSSKVKTHEINKDIEEFVKYLNIDTFKKDKTEDLFMDYIVRRVDEVTTNDFEKVKLYHDAVMCILPKIAEPKENYYKKQKEVLPLVQNVVDPLAHQKFDSKKKKKAAAAAYEEILDEYENILSGTKFERSYKCKKGKKPFYKKDYISLENAYKAATEQYAKTMEAYSNTARDYKAIVASRNAPATSDSYAILFRELCNRGNVLCMVIGGHTKKYDRNGYGWTVEDGVPLNFYWNIVCINGDYYLVDIYKDVSEIKGKVTYSDKWMFMTADEFVYTHYPLTSEFQLLAKPVSEKDYKLYNPDAKKKTVVKQEVKEEVASEEINLDDLSKKERKALEKQLKKDAKEKAKLEKAEEKAAKKAEK